MFAGLGLKATSRIFDVVASVWEADAGGAPTKRRVARGKKTATCRFACVELFSPVGFSGGCLRNSKTGCEEERDPCPMT